MCGRYGFIPPKDFPKRFAIQGTLPNLETRYNVTPGSMMPIIVRNSPNKVVLMRWGLIPFWAKNPKIGYKMINARIESIAQKPSFRKPLISQRCLVPASHFFEWQHLGKDKIPYCIKLKESNIFAFAGLYDIWKDVEGYPLKTFTIITAPANLKIAKIHPRMPLILDEEFEDKWLGNNITDIDTIFSFLKPVSENRVNTYPVTKDVNNPDNDNKKLIKPLS